MNNKQLNIFFLALCTSLSHSSLVCANTVGSVKKETEKKADNTVHTSIEAHTDDNFVQVIGSRINLIGEAVSASEGTVGQQEIEIRPLLRTGEVLELVPGMVVTQHSGTGKANQYFLRGFNLDHGTDFATFVDGMPVNMPTHGHGQGYTDLNFIIPEVISSISYKKGTYYAETGDFSGAGSAEMQTTKNLDKSIFEVTLGNENYQRLLIVDDIINSQDQWIYALETNFADGHWSDINENLKKVNGILKHHRELGNGELSFSLMAYDNEWNSADQIPLRAVESQQIDEYGSIDTTTGGQSSRYSLNANWLNQNWELSAYVIKYQFNLWSNFTYYLEDSINGDQIEQVDDRWRYGADVSYQSTDQLAGKDMFNQFGLTLQYDAIDEVGLYKTQQRQRQGKIKSDTVDELSIGLYWQNKFDLTSYLSSGFGLRYDHYDFDVASLIRENYYGINLKENGGSTSDSILSAKASLIYTINDNLEVYGSAGQGFHSNDARGTTIKRDVKDGSTIQAVEPLVKSIGGEIGLRSFYSQVFNTSVALWYLQLDSELIFVGDAGNTEPSDKSQRHGIELTTYYHLNQNWTIDLEYAQTDAKYSDAPNGFNKLPGSIDKVVQLGISTDDKSGYFGSLRFRYFGKRPLNESGSVGSDSSTMVNLKLGYRWNNWTLKTDILNLFDSRDNDIDYFYESQLPGETEPVEDFHFHPFEPRSVRVSISYRL